MSSPTKTPVASSAATGVSTAANPASGTTTSVAGAASTTGGSKATPKDAQVIATILRDMGVTEYEPRVVHQLLEFSYRYVSSVLEDAVVYSTYANKKSVDADDIRLAVEKLSDKMFTSPPPRDLLMEIARNKNNIPLPPIKSHAGPRLPPDRHSLISANYKCKPGIKVNGGLASGSNTPVGGSATAGFRSASGTLLGRVPPIISLQPRNPGSASGTSTTKLIIGTPSTSSESGVKRKLDSS